MYLPEDIVVEILWRLPLKSVKRFCCVSKSWHALIKNPKFLSKMHLNHYFNGGDDDGAGLLVSSTDKFTNKICVSLLSPSNNNDDPQVDVAASLSDEDITRLYENNRFRRHPDLLGPIDGIACLFFEMNRFALWNPVTGDLNDLPVARLPRPCNIIEDPTFGFEVDIYDADSGFGFDSKTNDYKVVQILSYSLYHNVDVCQVEICNSSTGLWRKLDDYLPALPAYDSTSSGAMEYMTYRKTTCCWWAIDWNDVEVILSLDMCTEVFQTTPLPPGIGDLADEYVMRAILPFNDSIALVNYPSSFQISEKWFDIWILNQLGNKESWTRLLRLGPFQGIQRPLCFWKNGKLLFEDSNGSITFHDPRTQELKELKGHGFLAKIRMLVVLVYEEEKWVMGRT